MALTLVIDGNNRTSVLAEGSLRIEQRADSFVSTCTFQIVDEDANITIAAKDVVQVADGATKYFEGTVANVKSDNFAEGEESLVHTIECQDYNLRLEEVIIDDVELWEAEQDDVIIDECFDEYLPEINTHPVGGGGYVDHLHVFAEFSVYQVSMREFMDQVCQQSEGPALVGYWYVDYDKNLHYFHAEADVSAWWLSDTPDDVDSFAYVSAIKRDRQGSAIVNRVLVVGADTALFVQDDASVALYGNLEAVIRDQNLITVDEMTDRGYEFLDKWANEQITYTVTTRKTTDLRAGMDIRFINTLFGVDDTFTIKQLTISWPEDTITFELTLGGVVAYSTLVRDRVDADRHKKVVLEVDQLPLSSRGWSHDIDFKRMAAHPYQVIEWTGGTIYTADGREFNVVAGDLMPGMEVLRWYYIYFDYDAVPNSTLQVTDEIAGVPYGRNIILLCCAITNPDDDIDKGCIFQVFGHETPQGDNTYITALSIVADTITANEIQANTITANEIQAATITATEIAANTIKTTNLSIGGFGDFLFRSTDLLLLGPAGRISTTEWYSTRNQLAVLSGAFHQEQGRWLGSKGIVVEVAATNLITNPSFEVNTAGWNNAGGSTTVRITTDSWSRAGTCCAKITNTDASGSCYTQAVVNPVQGTTYTASVWVRGIPDGDSIGDNGLLYIWELGGAAAGAGSFDIIPLTSGWQRLTVTRTIVENDRTELLVSVYLHTSAAGHYMHFDAVQLEETNYPTSYLDGSLGVGYAWTNGDHASTSTRAASNVNLTDYVDLIDGNTAFSVRVVAQAGYDADAAWSSAYPRLFGSWGGDTDNLINLTFKRDGDYFYAYINGAERAATGVQTFEAGDWLDVVLTVDFDNDEYNIYVNGELAGTDTTVLAPPTLTTWYIGNSYNASVYQWGGPICEFAVFGRVLDAEEIAGMYELHRPLVDVGSQTNPGIYVLDGMFYIASSTSGNRIEITSEMVAGYAGATKQFYLQASDGKAYAGAGAVILDSDGITVAAGTASTSKVKWKSGALSPGEIAAYISAPAHYIRLSVPQPASGDVLPVVFLLADSPLGDDTSMILAGKYNAGNGYISSIVDAVEVCRMFVDRIEFKKDLRTNSGIVIGSLTENPGGGDLRVLGGVTVGWADRDAPTRCILLRALTAHPANPADGIYVYHYVSGGNNGLWVKWGDGVTAAAVDHP